MARAGSRISHRHLLALCTFLVPLGLLGWLGSAELRRQGEESQAMLMTQALAFLRSAEHSINQHFDALLPKALEETATALADPTLTGSPAAVARFLRETSVPEALDLLLLSDAGALILPMPPPLGMGLPMSRTLLSSPWRQNATAAAVDQGESLARRGEFEAAKALLEHALEQLPKQTSRRPGAQGNDLVEIEVRAHFLLGGVERRLQHPDAARQQYQLVLLALPRQRQRVTDLVGVDLLTEIALAELDDSASARLKLMQEIADGNRDELPDLVLQSWMERLLAGIPEKAKKEHADGDEARRADEARRHGRAFAAEYDTLMVQDVRKRLRQTDDEHPIYYAAGSGNSGSLLAIRPATQSENELHGCSHVCLRLDLLPMLTGIVEAYVEDSGRGFLLAIEDGDGVPVGIGAPGEAPEGFDPPVLQTHGLSLRALPVQGEALVRNTEAAARNRALLMGTLFAVAFCGAFWLWRSVSRAADLAATKVDFVSRVSHELKTPLALIRMYGETLSMGRAQGEGQVQRFGGIVAREADRLTTMIQRILDFSRQQSGTLTYAPVPLDLSEQVRGIVDAYHPHLQAKGASLSTDLADGVQVIADAAALESAVVNLLENAIKYQASETPDPRIELSLSAQDGTARIDVADHGRGVPEAERHRIFESFYRASNAGEVRGAGLGLSLVQHFAQAHGGRIASLPREGGGSIFRLELPLLLTGT